MKRPGVVLLIYNTFFSPKLYKLPKKDFHALTFEGFFCKFLKIKKRQNFPNSIWFFFRLECSYFNFILALFAKVSPAGDFILLGDIMRSLNLLQVYSNILLLGFSLFNTASCQRYWNMTCWLLLSQNVNSKSIENLGIFWLINASYFLLFKSRVPR